jgi:RNA polymerase sigma-70 factor (ECF subfamily)
MERAEVRAIVRDCADQLPDSYRIVLILRDIEGCDTEETARLLGVTTGVVKTRLHRARQALRTLLDPHFRGDIA